MKITIDIPDSVIDKMAKDYTNGVIKDAIGNCGSVAMRTTKEIDVNTKNYTSALGGKDLMVDQMKQAIVSHIMNLNVSQDFVEENLMDHNKVFFSRKSTVSKLWDSWDKQALKEIRNQNKKK